MKQEHNALEKNNTWDFLEAPKGIKPIVSEWIYKIKREFDGIVIKHKAKLVAKGYINKYGLHYKDIFALVAKVVMVKILLIMAAQ